MKIAIYQTAGHPGNVEENLKGLEAAARRAEAGGAGLLVCPELYLAGYHIGDAAHELAEPADGPSARRAAEIAAECGIALLYGYPERDGDHVYNSALFVDAEGRRRANYRKTHLYGAEEKRLYRAGDEFVTVDFAGLRLGILICYDVEFPEAVRLLALRGADLVLVPTALAHAAAEVPIRQVPARAYENQIFIAYANRCGVENGLTFAGHSVIAAPDGTDLAMAGDAEEMLFADIDPAAFAGKFHDYPYLKDRRPELYGEISGG